MQARDLMIDRLKSIQAVDVLIVGGGINGIGVFRDLAHDRVSALLVERGDFCSGTSAAPSRLIHGGLRYLETGELSLVRESLEERNRLLLNAPHAVKPIRVWVPLRQWSGGLIAAIGRALRLKRNPGVKGAFVVKLGLMLYDILGTRHRTMPLHRFVGKQERTNTLSGLSADVCAVGEYFDAKVTMPERLGLELIADAESECPAALALSYVEVAGIENGAVRLRDVVGGHTLDVRPRVVVNCTGAWLDRVDAKLKIDARLIGGTKGSHLVLRHPSLAAELGDIMLYYETPDHRICLVYALDARHVLLGTTDMPTDECDHPVCTQAEVDYLYETLKDVMPGVSLSNDQIVFAYAGVRPLPATDDTVAGAISRDHELRAFEATSERPFPVFALVGGKWTTYRACAEQIADTVLTRLGKQRRKQTTDVAIGGSADWPSDDVARTRIIQDAATSSGLARERIEILFARYGTQALEYLATLSSSGERMLEHLSTFSEQEIGFIAKTERVCRLEDVLLRRTSIALLGDATSDAISEAGTIVGKVFGWDEIRIAGEVEAMKLVLSERYAVKETRL